MKSIIIVLIALFIGGTAVADTNGFATYFTRASCIREGTSGITASGKLLDDGAMWCALPSRPAKWGERIRVVNIKTGQSIIVEQQDLGPGKKARKRGVSIDLTQAAFLALGGNLNSGRIKVKIERVK